MRTFVLLAMPLCAHALRLSASTVQSNAIQLNTENGFPRNLNENAEDPEVCKALNILFPLKPTGEKQLQAIMAQRGWKPVAPDGADSTRFYPNKTRLFQDLYYSSTNPYEGIEVGSTELMNQYQSLAQQNAKTIQTATIQALGGESPQLVVEVGSFVGSGAVHVWGKLAKQNVAKDPLVLCVDTWQGDLNMKLGPQFQKYMAPQNGKPTLIDLFMRRIKHEEMDDIIFPLTAPSVLGARFIYQLGYKVDAVYVDSAHERGETVTELHLWYQLLRPGGVLLGDDFHGFPAVGHDVTLFAQCHNVTVDIIAEPDQWMIRKPL